MKDFREFENPLSDTEIAQEEIAQLESRIALRLRYLERTNATLARANEALEKENERLRKREIAIRDKLREHMQKAHHIRNPTWGKV